VKIHRKPWPRRRGPRFEAGGWCSVLGVLIGRPQQRSGLLCCTRVLPSHNNGPHKRGGGRRAVAVYRGFTTAAPRGGASLVGAASNPDWSRGLLAGHRTPPASGDEALERGGALGPAAYGFERQRARAGCTAGRPGHAVDPPDGRDRTNRFYELGLGHVFSSAAAGKRLLRKKSWRAARERMKQRTR